VTASASAVVAKSTHSGRRRRRNAGDKADIADQFLANTRFEVWALLPNRKCRSCQPPFAFHTKPEYTDGHRAQRCGSGVHVLQSGG